MLTLALLTTALFLGGIVLYALSFAALRFTALPPDVAGSTIRRAFPHGYLFVMSNAAPVAVLLASNDRTTPCCRP